MDRGRRYEEERPLGGETYRHTERSEPPRSDQRGYRSPPRRGRTPPPYTDTYAPSVARRRSRSPAYAARGGGSYRGRPRSPPPRGYSPRRETRARTPPARPRRYSRSPVRPRSPVPPRREPSPYNDRRPRSPMPAKRERMVSPTRERYNDRRGYSPPRTARPRFPNENNYRPAERSRSPPPRRSEHVSRIASPTSSRRSSPPIHPDRLANTSSRPHSPAYRASRAAPVVRDVGYRERSPPPRRGYSPVARSPPPRERDDYRNDGTSASWSEAQVHNSQASGYYNGNSRPPPTGPSRNSYARDSPSGHTPSAPISISAHNRPDTVPVHSAPSRPRGGPSFSRGDSRDQPYGGPPPHRGGRPPASSPYHGPPPRQHYDSRPPPSDYVPHGPRSSYGGPSPFEGPPRHAPPFRSNNSSSTTYPRTQRFATNHLASLPSVVPGGKALPSIDPVAEKKINQLEEDAKRLRDQIEEKQREKRGGLREWDSRERESRREGLRSELAEAQLEGLSGEVIGGTAF